MSNYIDGPAMKDMPEAVIKDLQRIIYQHTVTFIGVSEPTQEPHLGGSGTLVKAGNTYAILTAWHVIHSLPKTGRLGIFLEPTKQPHTLARESFDFIKIGYGEVRSIGPDIGAVVLSSVAASSLAAKKVFYNLDLRRDKQLGDPADLRDGVWVAQGFLQERSVTLPNADGQGGRKEFYNFSGIGRPEICDSIDDHDYFKFLVSIEARDHSPVEWGGMSGAGLWQVPMKQVGNDLVYIDLAEDDRLDLLFSGILFYQFETTATACGVRCHGRKSVFEAAYSRITNPN